MLLPEGQKKKNANLIFLYKTIETFAQFFLNQLKNENWNDSNTTFN